MFGSSGPHLLVGSRTLAVGGMAGSLPDLLAELRELQSEVDLNRRRQDRYGIAMISIILNTI